MKRKIMTAVLLGWAVVGVAFFSTSRAQVQEPQEKVSSNAPAPNERNLADLSSLSTRGLSLNELERVVRGLQIAPVPLDLQEKELALVGLGSYIVNGPSDCAGCHTNPTYATGGNPFLGEPEHQNVERYLAGGRAFGPFISRNLTPDEEGRPAGLRFSQFRRTLRTGADLKHLPPHVPSAERDLLQVMPWPAHGKMTDHDIRAIYEYLKAIPSRPGFPRE